MDSFEHLLQRTRMGAVPEAEDMLIHFSAKMFGKAAIGSPGFPTPIVEQGEGEIEFEIPSSLHLSGGEISLD